jgi:PKD repeat protein
VQNPVQDDNPPDQFFGVDRDGKYVVNWVYPAPPIQQPCKFKIEEANLFNTVFNDDASQLLVLGSNDRWTGAVQWISNTHPTTGNNGYSIVYTDNLNASLTTKAFIPIFNNSAATLSFDSAEDIEDGFDFADVEVSDNNGATFQTLAQYTGLFAGRRVIDVSAYSGKYIFVRFRFTSDIIGSAPLFQGWSIDNIKVESANFATIGTVAASKRTFDVTGRTGQDWKYAYRVGATFGTCSGNPPIGAYSNVQTIRVDIGTAPPTSSFTFSPNPGKKNQPMSFNASASVDNDTVHGPATPGITKYRWAFGDGTTLTSTNAIVSKTYSAKGNYRVTLTVTDNDGELATSEQTVQVTN